MCAEIKPSFAFLVLSFNHQDYILEHLESIKYLVQTHGAAWDIDLIVNDDCSRDQTRALIDHWLAVNADIFRHIKTIFNQKNLGTCASVNNMLRYMVADRCKLTAGDDVYSFENIFELTKHDLDIAMVSGRALYLLQGSLGIDRLCNILATATQIIYQNDNLLHRFKHFSYNNAPNTLYATECLLNPSVCAYLQLFDVTEDWPLQVGISRYFPKYKFKLIDEVLVYYRRTPGSTYIVANQRFSRDKVMIYEDLINNEPSFIERLRLKSRKLCFSISSKLMKKILNLDAYFFFLSAIFNCAKIISINNKVDLKLDLHKRHVRNIACRVDEYIKSIDKPVFDC